MQLGKRVFFALAFVFCFAWNLNSAWGETDRDARIANFRQELERSLVRVLDANTGEGTGQMARELRAMAERVKNEDEGQKISVDDIGEIIRSQNGGKPLQIPVVNYRRAIDQANERLRRAGMDFVQIVQTPDSLLIEHFRGFDGTHQKAVEIRELSLSLHSDLYSIEATREVVFVPADEDELIKANAALKENGVQDLYFAAIPNTSETRSSLLPRFEAPLKSEAEKHGRLAIARQATSPALALIGSVMGGGFGIPGAVQGLAGAALEVQFIAFTSWWAKIWDRYGFAGNVAVNASYGVILTAVLMATEATLHLPSSVNAQAFFIKTFLVGTTSFVASFGAMQIAAARLQHAGEFSEYGRFRLETFSVFWNNFGRVLALSAAGLGFKYTIGTAYGVDFGLGEAIGWGIQLAYLGVVTVPMWSKIIFGDHAYDYYTKKVWSSAEPSLRQRVIGKCAKFIGDLAMMYTPRRFSRPSSVDAVVLDELQIAN